MAASGGDVSANRRLGHAVDRLVLLAVMLCCGWIFSLPLRSHGSPMGFAQDDFYYYLKAAQNLAAGHGSTFDGTTLTNGYHPLYFLLWTSVSFFVHSLRGVFTVLWVLDTASATAIFLMARRIFREVANHVLLTNAFAVVVMAPCIATISYQMEVTLALPLGFAFLAVGFVSPDRYSPSRCAALGLLGALTMLARLDAGILICLFLIGLAATPAMRAVLTARNMASFSLASLPLLGTYFSINRHYFHEWLPISGSAKQLRHGWKPDVTQLHTSFSGFTLPFLAITVATCVAAVLLRRKLKAQEKTLLASALLMPLLFYTVEIFVSVWKLWGWYLYALRFSLLGSAVLVFVLISRAEIKQLQSLQSFIRKAWVAPLLLIFALLILTRTHYRVDAVMLAIADEDTRLNEFARSHPGRYAMGDRAGMFGYLSSMPLVQAEGLMMDRPYLEHIRREDDLLQTLRRYHVDYYVQHVFDSDAAEQLQSSCLKAQEPSVAGNDALRMRSTICAAPVTTIPDFEGKLYVYQLTGD